MNSKTLILLCLILSLAACTSVPISTMWKLRNLNPIEADPEKFQIAVITNKLIQLKDNSTIIGIGFKAEDSDYSFDTVVEASVKPNYTEAQLEPYRNDNERVTLFTINPEAVRQFRMAQSRLRSIKENGIEGDGSLRVNVNTGCFNGAKPEKVNANIFIMFEPSQGFVKLISNVDLLKESNSSEQKFWIECNNN